MKRHLRITFTFVFASLAAATLICSAPAHAQTPRAPDRYSVLSQAPLSTDLPIGQAGSMGATGNLRPDITYPTLRLDLREPRAPQPRRPAPDFGVDAPKPDPGLFGAMVRNTLGYDLPVFGEGLFKDQAVGFEPIDRSDIPANFVLGPGDEIVLRAWGTIDVDVRATLDRQGMISLPKVGQIALRGVRFRDLRNHLFDHFARYYTNFELSVSLGQLRSLQIYVTGFARRPGVYTVSALASPLNVLFYAGGSDQGGSLRAVEHRRDGQLLGVIDFYEFLRYGRFSDNVRIEAGDLFHVPAKETEIALAGAVRRPGIYQLLPGETLEDALTLAGGLDVTAATHRLVIERLQSDDGRDVLELTLDDTARGRQLLTGDLVLVQPVSAKFRNAITLRGNVAVPLRHQWQPGMRVADLLPSTEALIAPAYWVRRNEQDQVAEILARPAGRGIRVDFPDINWEYAVIERTDPVTWRTTLLPFNLHNAIVERHENDNLVLEPGDRVTVFAIDDFRVRRDQKTRFIRVEGEVGVAGVYEAEPDQTIAELIEQAGGLTDDAYLYGLELTRAAVRKRQQKRIQESVDRLEQDYYRHLIDRSRNVMSGDMTPAIWPEAAAIKGLVEQLRGVTPTGRIILELDQDIRLLDELPTMTLADGDTIYVPRRPETIEIVGAVFRQGSFVLRGDRLKAYIEQAGLQSTADARSIYVIRPDGAFRKAERGLRLRAGDTIVVPEKVDRERAVRRVKDWSQVIYQFGLGAAGINLLGVFR